MKTIKEQIIELQNQGLSLPKIAIELGIKERELYKFAKEKNLVPHNWKFEKKEWKHVYKQRDSASRTLNFGVYAIENAGFSDKDDLEYKVLSFKGKLIIFLRIKEV